MATVTSLYICISYIYTYFYNFNSLSSYIPILCQTFYVTCSMSFSSFGSMIYCILCTITYIISYPVPILCLLPCSGYTLMLYYSFLTYCFIMYCSFHILFSCYTFHSSLSYLYYRIRSCSMLSSCTFHILLSCTIHILHIHLYVHILSIIYFVLSYTFITFLVFIYLF